MQNCNMSVRCSDMFMEAVERDGLWPLIWTSKDNQQVFSVTNWEQLRTNLLPDPNDYKNVEYGTFFKYVLYPVLRTLSGPIRARQVWDMVIDNAWNHADPGIVFS